MDRYMDRLEIATWAALKAVHVLSSGNAAAAVDQFERAIMACHWIGEAIDGLHKEVEVADQVSWWEVAQRYLSAYTTDLPLLVKDLGKDDE